MLLRPIASAAITLEDVVGAITLFTQQPVRRLNNNVVIIPSSTFATAIIENYSCETAHIAPTDCAYVARHYSIPDTNGSRAPP